MTDGVGELDFALRSETGGDDDPLRIDGVARGEMEPPTVREPFDAPDDGLDPSADDAAS